MAKIETFDGDAHPPFQPHLLSPEQTTQLAELPLKLEPYIQLLALNYEIDTLASLSKEDRDALHLPPSSVYFIFYREAYQVEHERLSPLAFRFFQLFRTPHSLNQACTLFMESLTEEEVQSCSEQIESWLQNATSKHWLTLETSE